VSESVTQVLSY